MIIGVYYSDQVLYNKLKSNHINLIFYVPVMYDQLKLATVKIVGYY